MVNKKSIDEYVEIARETEGAVIVDVRNKDEFAAGHIPGAVNVPLADVQFSMGTLGSVDTPLYVYCLSGARSRQARQNLKRMGYEKVVNMGGIAAWNGEIEK